MKHSHFQELLSHATTTDDHGKKADQVLVQWDPERDPASCALPYRSIQIGIPKTLSRKWVEEWIESIEDVTQYAHALKSAIDKDKSTSVELLMEKGLLPVEKVYEVPEGLRRILKMDRLEAHE